MRQMRHLLEAKNKPGVVWIAPGAPVIDALRLMAEEGIGAVLVMDEGRLVGILSERDYARKVVLLGRTSATTPVSEIMSHQVVCGRLGDSIDQSMQVMTEKRIRHLPIVEHKEVVGIVSIGDLVKAVIAAQRAELRHLQDYIAG
ncbi:CBS domain-containing protein [Lysobacter pythonis]|uniref:CBS domain-containing protein n=1 Tax=Solilutibacter pythonis TaxID=2483112 RepID=A0A3M2HL61_9GAMM|nr:CBS domain-containing protein [Lysobacter pythonis]RMH88613.1 CBS domain-containing protein [Lysobacter pythonis]